MRDLHALNSHRQMSVEVQAYGIVGDEANGMFAFRSPADGRTLRVIAATGDGWEHVSVSKPTRTPTWSEMEYIKRLFFKPDEVCMQLHVAEAEHISMHDHCLHIWRPIDGSIPLPPAWMVGVKEETAK